MAETGAGTQRGAASFLPDLFDVEARRVVVTGGANGVGFAVAQALVSCGATVWIVDRDEVALSQAVAKLSTLGTVRAAGCDITDERAVDDVFGRAASAMRGLDVVFANAGIGGGPGFAFPGGSLDDVDLPSLQKVLEVNVKGSVATVRAAARAMRPQRSGKIVVTVSATALRPEPVISYAYKMSKAALVGLVEQAATELVSSGITVNAIAPGPLQRTLVGEPLPAEQLAATAWLSSITGMGRAAGPEELQGVALLLASRASDYMNGSVVLADGGISVFRAPPSLTAQRTPS